MIAAHELPGVSTTPRRPSSAPPRGRRLLSITGAFQSDDNEPEPTRARASAGGVRKDLATAQRGPKHATQRESRRYTFPGPPGREFSIPRAGTRRLTRSLRVAVLRRGICQDHRARQTRDHPEEFCALPSCECLINGRRDHAHEGYPGQVGCRSQNVRFDKAFADVQNQLEDAADAGENESLRRDEDEIPSERSMTGRHPRRRTLAW